MRSSPTHSAMFLEQRRGSSRIASSIGGKGRALKMLLSAWEYGRHCFGGRVGCWLVGKAMRNFGRRQRLRLRCLADAAGGKGYLSVRGHQWHTQGEPVASPRLLSEASPYRDLLRCSQTPSAASPLDMRNLRSRSRFRYSRRYSHLDLLSHFSNTP